MTEIYAMVRRCASVMAVSSVRPMGDASSAMVLPMMVLAMMGEGAIPRERSLGTKQKRLWNGPDLILCIHLKNHWTCV